MSKETAAEKLQKFLEKENIAVDVQIHKKRSADTGAWHDFPVLLVDYKPKEEPTKEA